MLKKVIELLVQLAVFLLKFYQLLITKLRFKIDFSNRQEYGWLDDTGKLSEDYQVIPDNDYYQNLSYSVKSPIEWDKFVSPVNSISSSCWS